MEAKPSEVIHSAASHPVRGWDRIGKISEGGAPETPPPALPPGDTASVALETNPAQDWDVDFDDAWG
jgi:hypothetical protein